MVNNVIVKLKSIGLNVYEGHGLNNNFCGNKSNIPINCINGHNYSINPVNLVGPDSVDVRYLPSIENFKFKAEKLYLNKTTSLYTGLIKPKIKLIFTLIKKNLTKMD